MAQYDGSIRINTNINTKEASAQLMTLENRIIKTADKVASLRSKMDSLKNTKIPTQEYNDIRKQIEDTEKKLIALAERQEKYLATGGKSTSSVYKKMNYDAEQLNQTLEHSKSELQELINSGKAFTLGSDTPEYEKLSQQLRYAENDLSTLNQKYSETEAKNEGLKNSYKSFGESIRNSFGLLKRSFKDIPISIVKLGIEGLKNTIKGFGTIVKKSMVIPFKLFGSTAKKTFSLISSQLKRTALSMSGFGKSTKTTNDILGKGFKNILKYGLGIRSFYVLVNKIRTGIKEGFSNLSNENDSFKNSVNSLKASLLTLKNAFAGSFAPIVQTVVPYLQKLIGWITSAVDAVGQFIAALTGKKTYIKAIRQTASAFEETSDATNDAKKAAEGYLSPLDEINKYSTGKTDGATSGEGSDAGGVGQMFEEVPIESRFQELVDKLKSFIKSEDWEGLGAYIASGINTGLQKIYDVINWDNVGPRITYFASAFTRTFNSLVDNINWDLLGRAIGAGINTIVNTLNLLIEGIDWKNLGKKFSEGIMGIVREVNWNNAGRLFGNKFMIFWDTLYGLVTNLKYDEIGDVIGDGLNGAVKEINLGTIGATLGRALTGLFQAAINFSGTFDWKDLGRNISDGINKFFQEFDGKTAAQGLTKFISGILDTILEVIATTDWTAVGRDIVDFIVNINWLELAGKLAVAALALIGGLVYGLITAIAETDWGKVWDNIVKAFKKFFGIHSPSTLMEKMGTYLMEGLFNGISSLIDKVVSIFGDIKDSINDKWESVKKSTTEKWDEIKQKIEGSWEGIKEKSVGAAEKLKSQIKDKWDETKQVTSEKWGSIKEKINSTWENMKTDASSGAESIKSKVKEKWGEIKSSTSSSWEGIRSSTSSAWEGIKSSLIGTWDTLKSKMSIFDGIKTQISNVWESVKRTTGSVWDGIVRVIKNPVNSIIGLMNGLIRGMASAVNGIANMLNSLSFDIPDWLGGGSFHLRIPTWTPGRIPYLATGTVVPPNKEFLAVLGDNTREHEVVSPLSTIEQAVRNVMSETGGFAKGGNITVQVVLEKKVLGQATVDWAKIQQMSTGKNPYELGTT